MMPETQPIRLATIGCGAVVRLHPLPTPRRPVRRPQVLVDPPKRNPAAASAMADRSKAPIETADPAKAAASFDAAIIAGPHILHGPIGKASIGSGKAMRPIGHAPRFDIERGMAATALYQERAFGARRRNSKVAVNDPGSAKSAAMAAG
jgi:hypothetical protein